MQIIRCTQKLLKALPMQPVERVEALPSVCWHANLLRIDRRKCLLFTHDTTLFSLFVPSVTKPDFKYFPDLFGQALFKAMIQIDFSQAQIESMLDRCRDIQVESTNNRSVLGSMNDMKQMIDLTVSSQGGLAETNIPKLTHMLNQTHFKAIGYRFPEEKMHDLMATVSTGAYSKASRPPIPTQT